jgi:membrane fusion protein (multidrug efflux system)
MMATAISESAAPPDVIFIPQEALLGYGEREFYVFIADEGIAAKRIVSRGESRNGWIRIIDGLSVGDRVITEGQNMIDAGQKIAVQE